MPAEWAAHERCLMAWPTRRELWGPTLEQARDAFAATAQSIARSEPVLVVANLGEGPAAAERLARGGAPVVELTAGGGTRSTALAGELDVRLLPAGGVAGPELRDAPGGIDVVELPIDDSWLRDNGPMIVRDADGERVAVDFRFNAWGERFLPYDRDAAVSARLCELLGLPRRPVPMVLEGGSICVDGEGTLLTTEQCLLHPNRNPGRARPEIERTLRRTLGVEEIVWLGQGLVEDRDTDGHVDLIALFTRPGALLLQTTPDPADPDHARCAANLERLRDARDAQDRPFAVTEFPLLPRAEAAGTTVAIAHLNLYLANDAAIVPLAGAATDEEALARIAAALPGREVVGVPGVALAYGGGGPHCITQQVPA